MSVVGEIVTVLALVAAGGASALVFRAEGKKAVWYLLMAIGFGLILLARIIGWFGAEESGSSLRMIGMLLASFSFVGSLWSRIREQVYVLLVGTGILKGPQDAQAEVAEPAPEAETPTETPPPAAEEPERTVKTPPPFDLPPLEDEAPSDEPLPD